MKIPNTNLSSFLKEIVQDCGVSRETRITRGQWAMNYFYSGAETAQGSLYNRTGVHVSRLASYLYSPGSVRYSIEFDYMMGDAWLARAAIAERFLSREYQRRSVDMEFAKAVKTSVIKGCGFVKHLWGHNGVSAFHIEPESMGVLREDIPDLDEQEAFTHSLFLTPGQFSRMITDHPDREKIMKKVQNSFSEAEQGNQSSFFHQMIIGGNNPVATGQTGQQSSVSWFGSPQAMLSSQTVQQMIRLDEIWIQDDEREDYTTFQIIDDIVIEGKYRRRNLFGIKGEHPFILINSNPISGYIWGRSEIAQLAPLQDMLTQRVGDVKRILDIQVKPPKAFIGFSGMTQEKYNNIMKKGGFISESAMGAKIEDLGPKLPDAAFSEIREIVGLFDEMGGFKPILQGEGEAGVRAGVHAQTLLKTASPVIRERSLLIERSAEASGDLVFKLLQAHEPDLFTSETGEEFLLSQMPDDYRVTIDSHSASPAFTDDEKQLAFSLAQLGAIGPEDLIEMTRPPRQDTLIAKAREKAAAQQKFMQEHPELLMKKGKK